MYVPSGEKRLSSREQSGTLEVQNINMLLVCKTKARDRLVIEKFKFTLVAKCIILLCKATVGIFGRQFIKYVSLISSAVKEAFHDTVLELLKMYLLGLLVQCKSHFNSLFKGLFQDV